MLMNNTEAETLVLKDGNQKLETVLPDKPQYLTCLLFNVEETNTLIKGAKLASCTPAMEQNLYTASRSSEKKKKYMNPRDLNVSTKMACSVCNKDFTSRDEQVQHYKLDWHRFNLKQKMRGSNTVPEELFTELAGDISSLSGSDSESDDDKGDGNTSSNSSGSPHHKIRPSAVPSHIRTTKDKDLNFSASDTENEETDDGNVKSQSRMQPKVYFQNSEGKIISLFRCVIHGKKEIPLSEEALLAKLQNIPEEMTWAIILVGGGHFAAALYDRANVMEHKTFHRYTVRAKQGSSQGLRDGRQGGHHSKSAGSSLRRYNEAALVKDIQDLLSSWSPKVQLCHRVFYRAPNFNRVILFGGKNPPFKKNDVRLRTIPFPTRRATYNEVQRVHKILATLECFGDGTVLNDIPHSPRVHLGTKKKKRKSTLDFSNCAVGAAGESVDKKNNESETEEPSQDGVWQKDWKIQLPSDLASDSDASTTIDSQEELLHKMSFADHIAFSKSKQRKGKFRGTTSSRRQKDPEIGSAADEKYQMRSELYTACKNNDVEKLCNLVSILTQHSNITLNMVSHLQQDVECKLTPSFENSVDLKTAFFRQKIFHNYATKRCFKKFDSNETVKISDEASHSNVNKDIADIPVYRQKYECRLPFRRHSFTSFNKTNPPNYSMPNLNVSDGETSPAKHSSAPASPRSCTKKTRSCTVTVEEEICPSMSLSMVNEAIGDGGATLLHTAANAGHSIIVKTLLEAGADPTLRNKKGQPPYVLSTNKEARNEFRRFMATYPDKYDYNKAQIPSALTASMENAKKIKQAEKKKEKKKATKLKLKEKKDLQMQITKEEEEKKCFLTLSDREKRALAAERRYMQQLADQDSLHLRPVLSRCFQCAVDITGKTPFEYLNYVFCSIPCLKTHRQTHT